MIAILAALALVGGLVAGLKFNSKSVNTASDAKANCRPQSARQDRQGTRGDAAARRRAAPSESAAQNGQDDQSAGADPSAGAGDDQNAQNGGSADQQGQRTGRRGRPCNQQSSPAQGGDNQQGGDQGNDQGGNQGGDQQDQQVIGPLKNDFVNIEDVQPNQQTPKAGANASTGTFTSDCGTNKEKHQNTDNVIVAPGVPDGAQHLHDYVGNKDTSAQSTNESLAAAGTTCANADDKSTYYWPVLRNLSAEDQQQLDQPAVKDKNNIGTVVQATSAKLEFRGNPTSKVVAMPRFLRVITGDAKSITNGLGNTRPSFTCTGSEDRLTNKYPICPSGSTVERVFDFASCWDGKNIDSANHRDHIKFPDANTGQCPAGTKAVPQLRITLGYEGAGLNDKVQGFDVDGFSTERHDPASDHNDFINVMSEQLAAKAARCINTGKKCT